MQPCQAATDFNPHIEDFMRQTQPKAKRSRLEPFQEPILLLKSKGYANWQVREWLVSNGVEISLESVRKFINKQKIGNSPAVAKADAMQELHTLPPEPDSLPTAFNPSDLRKILTKKIDLAALSKIGKDHNRQRKKDENSRH